MTHSHFDTQLDLIEQQFTELRSVVLAAHPQQVQAAASALQQLAVNLLQVADSKEGRAALQGRSRMQRIKSIANAIHPLREGLLRQSAYIDRALEVVMPSAQQQATYASGTPYGAALRQSGTFRVLSA